MSVLYNQFGIIEVVSDLKTKTIVIATNFKVDPSTVDLNTVSLYDYGAGSGQLADYTLHVDGKDICIILKDYPAPGTRFYLKVTDIYDALNRKVNHAYNDYIIFENEVVTDVEILSPGYREVLTQTFIDIRLKITNPLSEGSYRVQIAADNAFFKSIATVSSAVTDGSDFVISETDPSCGVLTIKTELNYNGQLFIRARAEKSEAEVGKWSEISNFAIQTIPAESLDTTFLEESITTYDLFPEEFDFNQSEPLSINEKSMIADVTDNAFYIEFNKEIKLPEDYKTDADGYVSLGVITGFRKGLK